VFALLERHRVALCLHDMKGSASPMLAIGPFVYVRFHGPSKYGGRYTDTTLERWAEWLIERARAGSPIYAYFNNDIGGHAPRDAARLRAAIERRLTFLHWRRGPTGTPTRLPRWGPRLVGAN
jgi:uncharacterized protein YecE (DUF72 family)